MQLYSKTFPQGFDSRVDFRTPVLIIPGLFGSSVNWRSFANNLSQHIPVIAVDQRNHGRSGHAATNSYSDMVGDLLEFLDAHNIGEAVLCGHSMGGKVAMMFSLLHPDRVAKLAVLDIAPVEYTHSHAPFLEELLKIDLANLNSRSEADRALKLVIPDVATRLFLLQSLTGSSGNYRWRLNLSVLHQEMSKLVSFPRQELEGLCNTVDTVFIYGEASNYLLSEHQGIIKSMFPNSYSQGIPNAGHWLHVEQPAAVLDALLIFLQNGKKND